MKKIVKYIVLFFNLLAVLVLLSACLAPLISPEKMPFLAFWGLVMPYSIILNVLFIVFWVLKARFYFSISLIAMLIAWPTTRTSFPYHRSDKTELQEGFKVMSYNVRVFDRYNWSKDKNNVSDMIRFIKKQNVDVLCLQEFGVATSPGSGVTETFILNSFKEFPYHYIHYNPNSRTKRYRQGLAIFSRYPISNRGLEGDISLQKGCSIFADIKVKNDYFRIINSHFESIHFNNKYDIIEGIDSDNYKTRIKGAIRSINRAAIQHSKSTELITNIAHHSPHPVVLCADMNNTPVSYSYHKLSKELKDAYLHQNTGFGTTYNGTYPFLRIDFIFHSESLPFTKYERKKVNYSDHFPVMAVFALE